MPAAGQRIKALDFTASLVVNDSTTFNNISTTLTAGTPAVEGVFVAPTSGRVLVTVGAGAVDDISNDNPLILDWELRLGTNSSGTLILGTGSSQRRLVIMPGTIAGQGQEASRTSLVTGLTAGSSYYVRTLHAAWAGATLDIYVRNLIVQPLPA